MICGRCGAYVDNASLVCDKCGTLISKRRSARQGVEDIRQGKPSAQTIKVSREDIQDKDDIPVYGDFDLRRGTPSPEMEPLRSNRSRHNRRLRTYERDAGRPQMQRGVPTYTGNLATLPVNKKLKKINPVSKRTVNWAKVGVVCVGLVLLLAIGIVIFMMRSLQGQVILARQGNSENPQALWIVGEEYLDQGYIDKAVVTLQKAREMELLGEDPTDNVDGLLLLGQAYEASDRIKEAALLYVDLFSVIVTSRPEPYDNMIRILIDRGHERVAGELMQLAFERTGLTRFRQQRTDLLPKAPETSLTAGRYTDFRAVELSSSQGYDVYYTTDATAKPEEGTLYKEPIMLEEGVTTFYAVCVMSGDESEEAVRDDLELEKLVRDGIKKARKEESTETADETEAAQAHPNSKKLVSDPLVASYTTYLPSPPSPKARLAPNTYKQKQRVALYMPDKDDTVTIYYTIDGSTPDADSPVYTGEKIPLATGNVTLKAIAVNTYGKASNVMEIKYKIDAKPYPLSAYEKSDNFGSFELMKTDIDAFESKFGKGSEETEVKMLGFDEACRRISYDWGSIIVGRQTTKSPWYLIDVDSNKSLGSMPRGISFGDSTDAVIGKFRDMLQPAGASGGRGLYYSDSGMGRMYVVSETERVIRYACRHTDGNTLAMELYFTNNKLVRFHHSYSFD